MLSLDTRLPTPHGWTTVKDLHPGTSVFDELGYPVFVREVGPVRTEKVYRVGFTNKREERGAVLMTKSQRLCTWDRNAMGRFSRSTGFNTVPTDWPEFEGKRWTVGEVRENYEIPKGESRELRHVIPCTFPLVLPKRDEQVEPYLLGLSLQINDPWTGLFKCQESIWDWYEKQFLGAGYEVERAKKRLKRWRPTDDVVFVVPELSKKLHRLPGYNLKYISEAYLRGSMQQRMELLEGLLDIPPDGGARNKQASVVVNCGQIARLSEQVLELVRGLGYAATSRVDARSNTHFVEFTPIENPYRYPKFRAQLPNLTLLKRNTYTRFAWRVQSVELDSKVEVRDFSVTSPSGLVTVSDLFLPVVAEIEEPPLRLAATGAMRTNIPEVEVVVND